MSRIANDPIKMPSGVDVNINGNEVTVKGQKGTLKRNISNVVKLVQKDNVLQVEYDESDKTANMMAGTARANVNNMVVGVSVGFRRFMFRRVRVCTCTSPHVPRGPADGFAGEEHAVVEAVDLLLRLHGQQLQHRHGDREDRHPHPASQKIPPTVPRTHGKEF